MRYWCSYSDHVAAPKAQPGDPAVARTTRSKSGAVQSRGGLVHGTGRVKPNGAVKRSDFAVAGKGVPTVTPPSQPQPAAPLKHRTVIDQGPIPLYCSDECQMSDLHSSSGVLSADYDPHRESTPVAPHHSYTALVSGFETESDSSSGGVSSVESYCSISRSSDSRKAPHVSPSIATIAALYDFPPLPPPPPIIERADSQSSASDSEHNFDQYESGVMMAARRIKAALFPDPVKRSAFSPTPPPPVSRQPIPGWTDGSAAWRSSVYSLSAPTNTLQLPHDEEGGSAYKSIVASPHRSRGVHSTIGETSTTTPRHSASTTSLPVTRPTAPATTRSISYADDLYSKYPLSFSRRSESRTSLCTPRSFPTSSSTSVRIASRQQEGRSLLKPGAEGKLLVPDVKLKVHTDSSLAPSLGSSASLASWRSGSSYPASTQRSTRSPLSRHGSVISEGSLSEQGTSSDTDELHPPAKRPAIESKTLFIIVSVQKFTFQFFF